MEMMNKNNDCPTVMVMSNSTDPIKVIASRFASLRPSVRMTIAKKLLEVSSDDQDLREDGAPGCSSPSMLRKRVFWSTSGMRLTRLTVMVNPFTEERS